MQPHTPFFSLKNRKKDLETTVETSILSRCENSLRNIPFLPAILNKFFTREIVWSIKMPLKIPSDSPFEKFWRENNIQKLTKHYEKNLKRVLSAVSDLIKKIEGKIIVTADHGEAFGEDLRWGHTPCNHIPVLLNVPWLEFHC